MKIILSRKGFDGKAGGYPSPIVDGQPISFPIPGRGTTYAQLGNGIGELIEDLTDKKASDGCHLDPDIDEQALPREREWRGAFGQVGGAQGHLKAQGVNVGDLFLFWGWFRNVTRAETWKYVGESEHRIFGWLSVGDVLHVGNEPSDALARYPWLSSHPHVSTNDWSGSNTVYVAAPTLSFALASTTASGWGVFRKGHRLTATDSSTRSRWAVPNWLNPKQGGVGLSGSCARGSNRWTEAGELNVGPGQEFVADVTGRPDAIEWLSHLFQEDGLAPSI